MKKRCELCNIEIDEHDYPIHLLGKKHLKNVTADNYKKAFIEKSIYVTRMPPGLTLDNICNFFTQFGAVEKCKLHPHFAIVEFTNKEPVDFLLSRPIWMGGHKLDIKRRRWNTNVPPKQQDTDKISGEIVFADLKTRIQSKASFDKELTAFLETVQLNDEEVDKNWHSIHANLLEALKPVFPNCTITRFGSSITGLCFKGSDIDIYLNIGQPIYDDDDDEVTTGEENDKQRWSPRKIFKAVKSYLYRRNNVFERIVPIPKAKTPIIKFFHSPTTTNCDISFKNGLGVINSELIKNLLCLDVRLKPLMIVIKYWAKYLELSGCGKFTNYAIVMMTIFYLQQPEIGMLPTIVELQRSCEPIYNWNWQVNFNRTMKFETTNTSTIVQLLHGFFKFYATFPYEKMIISPSEGRALSRTDFAELCAEKGGDPDFLSLDRSVCLQDPIELDNNITSGVNAKILDNFKSLCAIGADVCSAAIVNEGKPFLLDLFTTLPEKITEQTTSQRITIEAKNLRVGLPADFMTRKDIVNKDKFAEDNWYTLTQNLVEDAMRRVFKMTVQRITNDREAKQQKVAEPSDVHSKDNDKIILKCSGDYSVISDRRTKGFCIDPSLSRIDKESLISNESIEKQKKKGVKPAKIDFTCTIVREKNPVRLVIRLDNRKSEKRRFKPMASFISTKLPSIIDKELVHILQYNKTTNL